MSGVCAAQGGLRHPGFVAFSIASATAGRHIRPSVHDIFIFLTAVWMRSESAVIYNIWLHSTVL